MLVALSTVFSTASRGRSAEGGGCGWLGPDVSRAVRRHRVTGGSRHHRHEELERDGIESAPQSGASLARISPGTATSGDGARWARYYSLTHGPGRTYYYLAPRRGPRPQGLGRPSQRPSGTSSRRYYLVDQLHLTMIVTGGPTLYPAEGEAALDDASGRAIVGLIADCPTTNRGQTVHDDHRTPARELDRPRRRGRSPAVRPRKLAPRLRARHVTIRRSRGRTVREWAAADDGPRCARWHCADERVASRDRSPA